MTGTRAPAYSEDQLIHTGNVNDSKFRTQLCVVWVETGKCDRGESCRYAHGYDQLNNDDVKAVVDRTKFKSKLCKNWEKHGFCRYETVCCFAHGEEELRSTWKSDHIGTTPREVARRNRKSKKLQAQQARANGEHVPRKAKRQDKYKVKPAHSEPKEEETEKCEIEKVESKEECTVESWEPSPSPSTCNSTNGLSSGPSSSAGSVHSEEQRPEASYITVHDPYNFEGYRYYKECC